MREPRQDERVFFQELRRRIPQLHDWYHQDADGEPWMMVSYDFVDGGAVRATLRVDYDGDRLLGGWSPSILNWDGELRAADALIDTGPPDGLDVRPAGNAEDAAAVAAAWFLGHIDRWGRRSAG